MKRHVKERIARNKALAAADAKERCPSCKRVLPFRVYLVWGDPKMYCSEDCYKDYTDAAQTRPARVGRR